MRSFTLGTAVKIGIAALAAVMLAACGGVRSKDDIVQGANIPAGFDVTLVADKDNQFDYDGAPLTSEDLRSALRYRQEEKLPMGSVLLKRGEKEKVKKEHLVALARIAFQMKFKAYVEDKNGEISELVARAKEPESDAKKAETPPEAAKQ